MKQEKFKNTPLILIILDGWGLSDNKEGNAIKSSNTPCIDKLQKDYPYTTLKAHGKYVGLPVEQVGNSEAGHMNIGAGRLVEQDAVRINRDILNGNFFKNGPLLELVKHVKKNDSKLHIMGMISSGMSPHSDIKHLIGLLELARRYEISRVYLHLFTDGRDSNQYQAMELIKKVQNKLQGKEEIVTIMGRFYSMDRKKKWSRTQKAYQTLTSGKGVKNFNYPEEGLVASYNKGDTDEFIEPFLINDPKKTKRIGDNDGLIFFNLRSDRARQLAKTFAQEDFEKKNPKSFERAKKIKNLLFVAMTNFGPDLGNILTAYPDIRVDHTLPELLKDLKQLYISETEKYAHVSYFFNGGKAGKLNGEDYYILSSPNVKSYDKSPKMRSEDLCQKVLDNLKKDKYEVTVLNFPAPDMVGHTGNIEAASRACQILDSCLDKIVKGYLKKEGTIIITADHGNAEEMIDKESGQVITAHSTNPVPFILVNQHLKNKTKLRKDGILADISPTLLDILSLKKHSHMDGKSLIIK